MYRRSEIIYSKIDRRSFLLHLYIQTVLMHNIIIKKSTTFELVKTVFVRSVCTALTGLLIS